MLRPVRGNLCALAVVSLMLARAASATTANDLCAPAANPCVVSGSVLVTNGSVLDFGARALEIDGTWTVATAPPPAGGGTLKIIAGAVTLRPAARITAAVATGEGGSVMIESTGKIEFKTNASIDASGEDGGDIDLSAATFITLDGPLTADASDPDSYGGDISLDAGTTITLTAKGNLSVVGGKTAAGGNLVLSSTTGNITIDGDLIATGGSGFSGGSINIDAGGDLICSGVLNTDGTKDPLEGDGGPIDLKAAGNLLLSGSISARASASGAGGDVTLYSTNAGITLSGPINLQGGSPDGAGGNLDIFAKTTFVQQTVSAAINLSCGGIDAAGGSLGLTAAAGATLRNIDVTAGSSAGTIKVKSDGPIAALGLIAADGFPSPTTPRTVELVSTAGVTVSGRIHTNGDPGEPGGIVAVQGCTVTIASGAQLNASGTAGAVELRSSTQLSVAGALTAATANRLFYRDAGISPVITGNLSPAATLLPTPGLPACGIPPTTTTTTSTTTTTTSTTRPTTTTTTTTTTSTTTTTEIPTTTTTKSSTTETATSTTSTSTTTTAASTTSTSTTTTATTSTFTSTTPLSTSTTTTASSTSTAPTTSTASTTSTTTSAPASTSTTTLPPECTTDAGCDDHELCTTDRCSTGVCTHQPLQQYDAVTCRLHTMQDTFTNAAGKEIPNRTLAQRLVKTTTRARTLLERAQAAQGKRRVRLLRAVTRVTTNVKKIIARRAQRGKIDPTTALTTENLASDALARLAPLSTGD